MTLPLVPSVVGLVICDPARTRGMSVHGVPLTVYAVAVLEELLGVPVQLVGPGSPLAATSLLDLWSGADLVAVHDPMCPGLSASGLRRCLAAAESGVAAIGVRPVTDTVKRVEDGWLGATLDRDSLSALTSPVVFSGRALGGPDARLQRAGELADLSVLVGALAPACTLRAVEVPSSGRRVHDAADLRLLECSAQPSG
jgi:2-C-methyl-D-erythritol 4-phosphate cytidylyltransferase